MKVHAPRLPVIDAFKAIASQLIVLHHLAAYGPISDAVQQAAPGLISWLYDYARMAVQVFFVIGGYLAAQVMFSKIRDTHAFATLIFNRYLRLAIPFVVAVTFSIACAIVARQWIVDDFVPDAPTFPQLLAHLLMLQSVLDFDALLAGAWFIAIDFQLFILMLVIVWLGGKTAYAKNVVLMLTTLMVAASLFWFNRDVSLDDWAPYFFGAYGMGATAYWASKPEKSGILWLGFIVLLTIIALVIAFRARIMIALSVTIILFLTTNMQQIKTSAWQALPRYLGKISYSLFLVHFPILLLVNAGFAGMGFKSAMAGGFAMLITWAASLLMADIFYRTVEKPAEKMHKSRAKLEI